MFIRIPIIFLLLLSSYSLGFSALGVSDSFIISSVVFLFLFSLLLPGFNRFFSSYLASVLSALSVAFLISFSVYYNPLIVDFLFSFGPLLLGLVLSLVFIIMVLGVKSDSLRLLLVILSLALIGVFLYFNGFSLPALSFSSNNWFFDNLGLLLVGLFFVLFYLVMLKMVFFR